MNLTEKREGFSLIELLVIISIIGAILAMGGVFSGKFAARRSVDNVTRNISSTLQIAKLYALRHGVEYRAVLADCTDLNNADPDCPICQAYDDDYAAGDDTITITVERGNSNRGSNTWCVESAQTRRVPDQLNLDLADLADDPNRLIFNPNGTLVDDNGTILAQQIDIGVEPTDDANIKRCGRITVTPIGRIGIAEGNWNKGDSVCNPIE